LLLLFLSSKKCRRQPSHVAQVARLTGLISSIAAATEALVAADAVAAALDADADTRARLLDSSDTDRRATSGGATSAIGGVAACCPPPPPSAVGGTVAATAAEDDDAPANAPSRDVERERRYPSLAVENGEQHPAAAAAEEIGRAHV